MHAGQHWEEHKACESEPEAIKEAGLRLFLAGSGQEKEEAGEKPTKAKKAKTETPKKADKASTPASRRSTRTRS